MAGYGTHHELQENSMDFAALLKRETWEEDCHGIDSNSTLPTERIRRVSSVSSMSSYAEPDEVCFYLKKQ